MEDLFGDFFDGLDEEDSGNVGEADVDPEDPIIPVLKKKHPRQFALDHLVSRGMSREDAAAMVLNFTQESGVDLNTKLVHDAGTGVGIAGFRDPSPGQGRKTNLMNFARSQGRNPYDLATQLDFAYQELQGPERAAYAAIQAARTPEEKAVAALKYFRPAAHFAKIRAGESGDIHAILNGQVPSKKQYTPEGVDPNYVERAMAMREGQPRRANPMVVSHTPEQMPPLDDTGMQITQPDPYADIEIPPMMAPEFELGQIPEEIAAANRPFIAPTADMGNKNPLMDPNKQRGLEQVIAGAATNIPNIPLAAAEIGKIINPAMSLADKAAGYLTGGTAKEGFVSPAQGQIEQKMEDVLGVGEPESPFDRGKRAIGRGGVLGVGNAVGPIVGMGAGALFPEASAAGKNRGKSKAEAKALTDWTKAVETADWLKSGLPYNSNSIFYNPKLRPVFDAQRHNMVWNGGPTDFTIHKQDGKWMVLPTAPDGTFADTMRRASEMKLEDIPQFATEKEAQDLAAQMRKDMAPDIARRDMIVQSDGGPLAVNPWAYMKYGVPMMVASVGAVLAPRVLPKIMNGLMPRLTPKTISGGMGPEDIGVASRWWDLAEVGWHSKDAGPLNIMKRVNPDPMAIKRVEHAFETAGAAQGSAESATKYGNMRTSDFHYNVSVPIEALERKVDPLFAQYMHYMNMQELMIQAENKAFMANKPPPVFEWVREQKADDILAIINELERRGGQNLKNQVAVYRENLNETLRYQSHGTGATMTLEEAKNIRTNRKHYIPGWDDLADVNTPFPSPATELKNYIQKSIKGAMDNNAEVTFAHANENVILPGGKRLMRPLTEDELSQTSQMNRWKPSTRSMKVNGETQKWVMEPFLKDTLARDPYYNHPLTRYIFDYPRGVFQMTTTGGLAPGFAPTSFSRNHMLTNMSLPPGRQGPTIVDSLVAIPEQMIPQATRAVAESLDRGSLGWIPALIGRDRTMGWATRALKSFENTLKGQLESVGSHHSGGIFAAQKEMEQQLGQAIANHNPWEKTAISKLAEYAWSSWHTTLQSIHNAPAFAYAKMNKNLVKEGKMTMADLAAETRAIVGNNQVKGQFWIDDIGAGGKPLVRPIRMQAEGLGEKLGVGAARGIAFLGDVGRTTSPWFNVTIQGQKRLLQAYKDNPDAFVARLWAYHTMPAAMNYLYVASLGNDPNGRSYVDWMQSLPDWQRGNFIIPIKGWNAERSFKIPIPHEFWIFHMLMRDMMHHATASNTHSVSHDMGRAFGSYAQVMVPATPQILNIGLASAGMMTTPGGAFGIGTEAYRPRRQAYDQYGTGLSPTFEALGRALGGGVADVALNMIAAYQDANGYDTTQLGAAAKAGWRRSVEKSPFGSVAMKGNTPFMDEYYDYKKNIDDLMRHYRQYDKTDTAKDGTVTRMQGHLSNKPASQSGALAQSGRIPTLQGTARAGMGQPPPDNPAYIKFMEEIYNKFGHDSLDTGGVGFKTAGGKLQFATQQLRDLSKVNEGTMKRWVEGQDSPGKAKNLKELKDAGINPYVKKEVETFYGNYQREAVRDLLFQIKTVEREMSEKFGQEISLKKLSPYGDRGIPGAPWWMTPGEGPESVLPGD